MNDIGSCLFRPAGQPLNTDGLHDAVLQSITFNWPLAEATLLLAAVGDADATLTLIGVTEVVLPKRAPWGASNSVNDTKCLAKNLYQINMQSGDSLRFEAEAWSLAIHAQPSDA